MRTKAEIAIEDYHEHFNCAQSTLAVFAEDYELDVKTALRMTSSFGGGCQYGGICGAIIGSSAVIGLKYGNDTPDRDKYNFNRKKVREFIAIFKEKHGATNCSDLLGVDMEESDGRDKARALGLFKTQCADYVRTSVEILEELGY